VGEALPGLRNLVNLTACPANVENLTALIVYRLSFNQWPPLDDLRRPLFANAKLATFYNCPTVRWNEGTSWPVGSGHGCIGCAEPRFWDRMIPFYAHLPISAGIGTNVDRIGIAATGAVAAAFAVHGVTSLIKRYAQRQLPPDQTPPPPRGPEGE
jgi:hydrogenase small subunit